jgi:general secretion pathway protein I
MKRGEQRFPVGFTLLEVLVALAIMGIALTLILQLFSANLHALAVSGDVSAAAAKANTRLRELLAESSLAEGAWSERKEPGYPMDIAVTEILRERTDHLAVKLMDVLLTVRWTTGRKEKKLTLETMKMVLKVEPESTEGK